MHRRCEACSCNNKDFGVYFNFLRTSLSPSGNRLVRKKLKYTVACYLLFQLVQFLTPSSQVGRQKTKETAMDQMTRGDITQQGHNYQYGDLQLPHGRIYMPVFMPDATLGVVRSVDATDLMRCEVQAVVMN